MNTTTRCLPALGRGLLALLCALAVPGALAKNGQDTVAAGTDFVLALDNDGSLWRWGSNENGQLGLGYTGGDATLPEVYDPDGNPATPPPKWRYVAAGRAHALAIREDGQLWSWGANNSGQLGQGNQIARDTPTRVGTASNWTAVAAAGDVSAGIAGVRLYLWGDNTEGAAGENPDIYFAVAVPEQATVLPNETKFTDWVGVAVGYSAETGAEHVLALRANGELYAFGSNGVGQLGIPESFGFAVFKGLRVGTATDWTGVSLGGGASFAFKGRNAFIAGLSLQGSLGNGGSGLVKTFTAIPGVWDELVTTGSHSLGLRDGLLFGMGDNTFNELGFPIEDDFGRIIPANLAIEQPTQLIAEGGFTRIAVGTDFSIAWRGVAAFGTGLDNRSQLGVDEALRAVEFQPLAFGSPDLSVDAVVVRDSDLVAGGELNVAVNVRNNGVGPFTGGGEIFFVLSEDNVYDLADLPLLTAAGGASVALPATIAGTTAVGLNAVLRLPNPITAGEYFVIAVVQGTASQFEYTLENNDGASGEPITLASDLAVSVVRTGGTGALAPGSNLPLQVSVTNNGVGTVPESLDNPITLTIYLTQSATAGAEERTLLLETTLDGQFGLGTRLFNFSPIIPAFVPPGSYRLEAEVSAGPGEGEDELADNFFVSSVTVLDVVGVSLREALDYTRAEEILSGGDSRWFATGAGRIPGQTSAQTPPLAEEEESFIEVTVPGPSVVTFWWRAQTSTAANYLAFTIDNFEPETTTERPDRAGRVSGNSEWVQITQVAPAAINVLRWTYVQGAATPGDFAQLDTLSVVPMTQPDLAADSVSYTPGVYVPGQAELFLVLFGRNQGLQFPTQADGTPIYPNFGVRALLSRNRFVDADDLVLGTLTRFPVLDVDNRFGFSRGFEIGTDAPAGEYYVILQVDVDGEVAEFDEDNNIFVSDAPDVIIEPRPDLIVSEFLYPAPADSIPPQPTVSLAEAPLTLTSDELDVTFTVSNNGEAAVPRTADGGPEFNIDLVVSRFRDLSEPFVIASFREVRGVPAGGSRTYFYNGPVPQNVPKGVFLYVGLLLDGANEVLEKSESNNRKTLDDSQPNVIFTELTLAEALDLTGPNGLSLPGEQPLRAVNVLTAPFFGQSDVSFDGEDAVASSAIADSTTAGFSLAVRADTARVLVFNWLSSSERFQSDNGLTEDFGQFLVDGVELARISGELGQDQWREVRVTLPAKPGDTILTWNYVKNAAGASGQDRIWVDNLRYDSPDITFNGSPGVEFVSDLTVPKTVGDTVSLRVNLVNNGITSVPESASFRIQVRVAQSNSFAGDSFLIVAEQFVSGAGLTRSGGSKVVPLDFELPVTIANAGDYFVQVVLDSTGADPATQPSQINESDENNNVFTTASARLQIELPLSIEQALDVSPESLALLPFTPTFTSSGTGNWYAVAAVDDTGDGASTPGSSFDGVDSVRPPPLLTGQTSFLETIVRGPAEMTFRWRSSTASSDQTILTVNGVEVDSIGGITSFAEEKVTVFIPAGDRVVRWTFNKLDATTAGAGTSFVDDLAIVPVTLPELVVTRVDPTYGNYILDVATTGTPVINSLLGTEYLDLRVEVENQGQPLGAGAPPFTVADVELRLSSNNVFGDADDILLGNFAQVEQTFSETDTSTGLILREKLRFSGPIKLGDHIPAGCYYVLAQVNPLGRVTEYSTANNTAASSNAGVCVIRLPNLVAAPPTLSKYPLNSHGLRSAHDENKLYFPGDPFQVRFSISNNGLAAIEATQTFNVRVVLYAFRSTIADGFVASDYINGELSAVLSQSVGPAATITLGEFAENERMLGRRLAVPGGDTIDYSINFNLPHYARLQTFLDDPDIEDYVFAIGIFVDSRNQISESDERNLFGYNLTVFGLDTSVFEDGRNVVRDGFFEIRTTVPLNYADWQSLTGRTYVFTDPDTFVETILPIPGFQFLPGVTDHDGDGLSDFFEYAFNRNPFVADGLGVSNNLGPQDGTDSTPFTDTYGFVFLPEEQPDGSVVQREYLRVTFNFPWFVEDLTYFVEGSNDGTNWETVQQLFDWAEPAGYSDSPSLGGRSLTGEGGLIEQPNVVALSNGGYSATITVRDTLPTTAAPVRFLRVRAVAR